MQKVDQLYNYALFHYDDSALLHIFIATYLSSLRSNVPLEMLHLACAEVLRPGIVLFESPSLRVVEPLPHSALEFGPESVARHCTRRVAQSKRPLLDVQFFIYKRRREILRSGNDDIDLSQNPMPLTRLMKYDTELINTRNIAESARKQQVSSSYSTCLTASVEWVHNRVEQL